jgi:hypothetical protein
MTKREEKISEYRRRARERQIAAGNDPEHTKETAEERADFNSFVATGPYYRKKLAARLAKIKEPPLEKL